MTYMNRWPTWTAVGLVIAACMLSACGSSSNDNSTPSDSGTGGKKSGTGGKGAGGSKASTGGAGGSGSAGMNGSAGMSAKAGSGGEEAAAGMSGAAGGGACEKKGSDKCYTCDAPSTDEQFLNRCTTAMCTAYDNSKLTKVVNGKLPDLPN